MLYYHRCEPDAIVSDRSLFQGWVVASSHIMPQPQPHDQSYVVSGLRPSTSYMFLVRAENSHGLSLPSPVTTPVKTKGCYTTDLI